MNNTSLRFPMKLWLLGAAFLMVGNMLSGCTEMQLSSHVLKKISNEPAPYQAPPITGPRKIGNPYDIFGKTYYPLPESEGYREKGIASWYGKEFHGRKTANGEKYNMYQISAAHPTLPLPTYVRVTNLENGRSLVARVNDRGPFLRGRLIDMSYAGAQALGFDEQGTAPVLVEALPTDGSPLPPAQRVVQFASADRPRPKPPVETILPEPAGPEPEALAGMSKPRVVETTLPQPADESLTARIGDVRIFVQTGAFTQRDNAMRQSAKVARHYNETTMMTAKVRGKHFYRVRVGPLQTVDIADEVLARLASEGWNDAHIVID